jgi:LmbE family N-acetylglucosaminyl deacetylase
MIKIKQLISFVYLLSTLFINFSVAQPKLTKNASEIKLDLEKLNVLGSVLYIAAHPDDENTAVLAYYSKGKLLQTSYLSLTRGDGGQNLIGTEQSEELGLIRTQELLSARRIDGAEQFFIRAVDFGYSKSAEETFQIWNKEKLLSDVVWVIRKVRPDIIITRFPSTGEGGHGQHTASALLAEKAFYLAGDETEFPEQLQHLKAWQPRRLFWNAWLPQDQQKDYKKFGYIRLNIGEFNKLLGKSYTEISANSRTMHKSQGFGSSAIRGDYFNYFKLIYGDSVVNDLFEGIDLSWNRIRNSEKIQSLITLANNKFNYEDPSQILPILTELYSEISKIDDDYWREIKLTEVSEIIRSCSGLWFEAVSTENFLTPGSSVKINLGVVNRSESDMILEKIRLRFSAEDIILNQKLLNNQLVSSSATIKIPESIQYSNPFWLGDKRSDSLYSITDQKLIGKADRDPSVVAEFVVIINGKYFTFKTPVNFKFTDQVDGEIYRPIEIIPSVTLRFAERVIVFSDLNPKKLNFTLTSYKDSTSGKVKFILPSGWKCEPELQDFSIDTKGETLRLSCMVYPPTNNSSGEINAALLMSETSTARDVIHIDYKHIPFLTLIPVSKIACLKIDTKKIINKIGYIMGSGDEIPQILSQLGYEVTLLSDEMIVNEKLDDFDAIISGVRAYNTRNILSSLNSKLLEYVNNGGTYIVQYNINRGLVVNQIGPYRFNISRDRVTEENSSVNFEDPSHLLLNSPNKISQEDFNNWIQERGLYFADSWAENYETPLSCNDKNEENKSGGLLYTRFGKGVFIYTGYSWFRQLPAAVPGAIRFFVNLISAGKVND